MVFITVFPVLYQSLVLQLVFMSLCSFNLRHFHSLSFSFVKMMFLKNIMFSSFKECALG